MTRQHQRVAEPRSTCTETAVRLSSVAAAAVQDQTQRNPVHTSHPEEAAATHNMRFPYGMDSF